eukprot:TRINITY_DN21765_c1_g1_i1.p1 TRINITY_DN21765_c1_g1~~TRINITY_DN21765_c1_g1_i1.p1  ORF type:complete len:151 (+),score=6.41 TRINITY_DN21765_c1_g1_i1:437-889(+)
MDQLCPVHRSTGPCGGILARIRAHGAVCAKRFSRCRIAGEKMINYFPASEKYNLNIPNLHHDMHHFPPVIRQNGPPYLDRGSHFEAVTSQPTRAEKAIWFGREHDSHSIISYPRRSPQRRTRKTTSCRRWGLWYRSSLASLSIIPTTLTI